MKTELYGVGFDFLNMTTIENIIYGTPTAKQAEIDELAKKYGFACITFEKNKIFYLFELDNDANMFYNELNEKTKWELVKKPFEAERNTLNKA